MGRLVRRYIRAYSLDVRAGGLKTLYSDSVYWTQTIADDGALTLAGVGGSDDDFEIATASGDITLDAAGKITLEPTIETTAQYGVGIAPADDITGEYETCLRIDGDIAGAKESRHGAGLKMTIERPADHAFSAWGGSPDTAMMIDMDERANNTAAVGASRGLQIDWDNYGSLRWVHGMDIGVTNRHGVTGMAEMWGEQIVIESYAPCSDLAVGLDIVMLDEYTKPTEEYGIRIRNTNDSITQAVDAAIKITRETSKSAVVNQGFNYLIDAMHATNHPIHTAFARLSDDGTVCADAGDKTGAAAGWITVIIGASTRYIQLYS